LTAAVGRVRGVAVGKGQRPAANTGRNLYAMNKLHWQR
jgi:hypothetical protein